MSRGQSPASTRAMFDRLWAERETCAHGHSLAEVGVLERVKQGYRTRRCRQCVRDEKAANYRRLMADPVKAQQRRESNRAAQRRHRKGATA